MSITSNHARDIRGAFWISAAANFISIRPIKIAGIGSGTGILTELFLQDGNNVLAFEPNDPMRLAAEKALVPRGNFHSVRATGR